MAFVDGMGARRLRELRSPGQRPDRLRPGGVGRWSVPRSCRRRSASASARVTSSSGSTASWTGTHPITPELLNTIRRVGHAARGHVPQLPELGMVPARADGLPRPGEGSGRERAACSSCSRATSPRSACPAEFGDLTGLPLLDRGRRRARRPAPRHPRPSRATLRSRVAPAQPRPEEAARATPRIVSGQARPGSVAVLDQPIGLPRARAREDLEEREDELKNYLSQADVNDPPADVVSAQRDRQRVRDR